MEPHTVVKGSVTALRVIETACWRLGRLRWVTTSRFGTYTGHRMDASGSLTDMIRRAQTGDASALKDVFEVAYQELRGLARARLRKGSRRHLARYHVAGA